ncbi:MAG: hypothetical protein M0R39_06185 [Prolixibacteraceae bacterium]|jgi:hypothetical protein|nr:hypothetical protein [Prolixibacteraceae bacterium]
MRNNKNLLAVFFTLVCFASHQAAAQSDVPTSPFKATADLVSHYVWRGSMATGSPTPNFQPTLSFTKGKLEIGVWGSTDFVGSYKEVDPYVSISSGQLKFVVTDYNWNFDKANYFNYKNSETGHRLEGTIGFTGPETLPISVTWNTMLYGLDKKSTDSTKQAYSTYIELGYSKGTTSFFFGFTPWSGYYNNYGQTTFDPLARKKTFSIVNIGASVTKALKITEKFSLPLKTTLVINPSATYTRLDYLHLVFGITL